MLTKFFFYNNNNNNRKNSRKIKSLISDNKGRERRCHLEQLLEEPRTNNPGEPQTNQLVQLVCIPQHQPKKRSTKLQTTKRTK